MKFKSLIKGRHAILLVLIIALAFALRFMGAGWGLQYNGIQKVNPHYDEGLYSVNFSKEIDLKKMDFISESAQKDGGSLMYYLWAVNAWFFKTVGLLGKMPAQIDNFGQDYSDYIYYSRLLMVLIDVLSVALMFLIVKKITGNKNAALFAAFIFAIIPYEIMHSNYMRPHILVNFFVVLIIYLSLFIYERKKIGLYILTGLAVGLCAAARYTFIVTAVIPVLFFYWHRFSTQKPGTFAQVVSVLFNYRLWVMALFILIGLIIGNPVWVFDTQAAIAGITFQGETGRDLGGGLWYYLKTIRYYLFRYVLWIIPAGTFLLWIIFYPAWIYSLFLKKYLKYLIPLTIFSLVFFFPMIASYPIEAIRAALPLFPVFAIISGIALSHFYEKYAARKTVKYLFIGIISFISLSTTVFSFSMARAMGDRSKDAYIQAATYFQNHTEKKQLNIALVAGGYDIFILPNLYYTLNSVPGKKFNFYDGNFEQYIPYRNYDGYINYSKIKNDSIDYLMICNIDYCGIEPTKAIIENLTKNNDFVLEKEFKKDICFYGLCYDYSYAPHDFRYPFQTFELLKANNKRKKEVVH